MDKLELEEIRAIKSSINPIKSRLLEKAGDLQEFSPREAEKLYRIIEMLEDWQNKERIK